MKTDLIFDYISMINLIYILSVAVSSFKDFTVTVA